MAFWYQIRHSKISFLSQQCKRWYSQIPRGGVSSAYCGGAGGTNIRVYEKPNLFICRRPTDPYNNTVRFFAAPVQTKPKPEAKDSSGTRLNNQIKADEDGNVRLVGDEGHVVVALHEALDRAKKLNLDLVEVDRSAKIPVCKIMDFHRENYKQQLKEKDRVNSKTEVTLRNGNNKEVRVKAKCEQKDLQMKANMAIRLMEKGYRVKCMAIGKEEEDLGGMLSRLSTLLEDIAVVESGPHVEKKQAYIVVRHVKFGPLKKGPSKKISELMATRTEVQNAATASPTVETSSASEQAESPSKCSMKTTDGKPEKSNMVWSEFGKSDDFQEVFDFDRNKSDNAKGFVPTRSSERASTDPKAGHSSFRSVQQHNPNISQGAPGSVRVGPQFPNQGRQPQTPVNAASPSLEQKQVRNDASTLRPLKQPPADNNISQGAPGSVRVGPQFPNQGRQPQTPVNAASPSLEQKQVRNDASTLRPLKQPPADNNTRKQEPYRPSTTPTPPPSSYGIFSTPNPTILSQQGRVRASNTEVKPLDSKKNPSSSRSSLNENPADSRRRPEVDQPSQGAWGIFSRESSGANQNSSDGKTNRQR